MKKQFKDIIEDFKWYYNNSYITSKDGNACVRFTDPDEFYVTQSGVNKYELTGNNFHLVEPANESLSIETGAHLLALNKTKQFISVHVHPPSTVALFSCQETVKLENEIGCRWPELFRYTKLGTTVPELAPGSHELHESIGNAFKNDTDIIVMKKHGVLAVGPSAEACKNHIVRLEHVSNILLKMLSAGYKL